MQEKKKIFQPKVIIGSITSFIVAAVGVVAVFFPDLFNLQKKSLNEMEIVLKDDKDKKTLIDFINDLQGRAMKLSFGYCVDPKEVNLEFRKQGEKTGKPFSVVNQTNPDPKVSWGSGEILSWTTEGCYIGAEDGGIDCPAVPKNVSVYTPIKMSDFIGLNVNQKALKEHKLVLNYDNIGEVTNQVMEHIGFEGMVLNNVTYRLVDPTWTLDDFSKPYLYEYVFEGNKNYTFAIVDQFSMKNFINKNNSLFEKLPETCSVGKAENQDYYMAFAEGYFFVNDMSTRVEGNGDGDIGSIVLEPISKKEFELKNY